MSSTQVKTRRTNTEEISMEHCLATVDSYQKRRSKKISKRGGAESDPAPVGAQPIPNPGASSGADGFIFGGPPGETNSAPIDVWDQIFKDTDYIRLAGNTTFFQQRVFKALPAGAPQMLSEILKKDMMKWKEDFVKTKETDRAKLRLLIQERFTQIVLQRVVTELRKCKGDLIHRVKEFDELSNQVARRKAVLEERTDTREKTVEALENCVNRMADMVIDHLKDLKDEDPDAGSIPYTLTVLLGFLKQKDIELPRLLEGARTGGEPNRAIFKSEYEQLPKEIKEYFVEASNLLNMANNADEAEKAAEAEYNLAHESVDNETAMEYYSLRERLALILESETIAGRIIDARTFWLYEDVLAPGSDNKVPMDSNSLQKIVEGVEKISKNLEEADREENVSELQQEVEMAKNYLQTIKGAVAGYSNISPIQTAIIIAESSITIYERVVARRIKDSEAHVASRGDRGSSDARDSGRTSSSDVFARELDGGDTLGRKRRVNGA